MFLKSSGERRFGPQILRVNQLWQAKKRRRRLSCLPVELVVLVMRNFSVVQDEPQSGPHCAELEDAGHSGVSGVNESLLPAVAGAAHTSAHSNGRLVTAGQPCG